MRFKQRINNYRRAIMRGLTKNVGSTKFDRNLDPSTINVQRVLLSRPNHRLGNMLLITPLVQEISTTFPGCKIDLFVKGNIAPIVFENYQNVDRILKLPKKHFKQLDKYLGGWIGLRKHKYDIIINVDTNSSSGRLSSQLAKGRFKFFGDIPEEVKQRHADYRHMAKFPVYNFRYYLTQLNMPETDKPIPTMSMQLSDAELQNSKKLLQDIVKNDKKTISIFTYATGDKCYKGDFWNPLYERLLAEFPDYNIVEVLPVENVSQINFKAPSFYSKDVREICAFIANTDIFVGADSGIMHLANASQTPTVGFFTVTDTDKYGPYGNHSLAVDTDKQGLEDYISIIKRILNAN